VVEVTEAEVEDIIAFSSESLFMRIYICVCVCVRVLYRPNERRRALVVCFLVLRINFLSGKKGSLGFL